MDEDALEEEEVPVVEAPADGAGAQDSDAAAGDGEAAGSADDPGEAPLPQLAQSSAAMMAINVLIVDSPPPVARPAESDPQLPRMLRM